MSLLEKLAKMDIEDMDSLNSILDQWSVSDIRTVLDEIEQSAFLKNCRTRSVMTNWLTDM